MPSTSPITRAATVLTAVAAVLAGCATNLPAGEPTTPGPVTSDVASFPQCAGRPWIYADPALYRDTPTYGNATELVEQVARWAEGEPGFEQLWLDRERNGWVTVGFHGEVDVAALQAEVEATFPGEGVVVVEVPFTQQELLDLADRLMSALSEGGVYWAGLSADVHTGVVGLDGVMLDEAAQRVLAGFAGEPICVDTIPVQEIVPVEQPTGGEGWRLLGEEPRTGEAYRTGIATTDEQLAALWLRTGLPGEAPPVDWETEVVVWFGDAESGSCPTRLVDVLVTGDVLHADFVMASGDPMPICTDDANPHAYVVAVDRALLPPGPFAVQLTEHDPPAGVPEERTEVDADLTAPASVVG